MKYAAQLVQHFVNLLLFFFAGNSTEELLVLIQHIFIIHRQIIGRPLPHPTNNSPIGLNFEKSAGHELRLWIVTRVRSRGGLPTLKVRGGVINRACYLGE